ncbi:hypothetical protein AB1Y20_011632 [Prymnesium parvum]|uniref:Uncharacterized protein n=1 Tax=Prymnesium parvum TaxID=97485 RepID=A0AB34IJY6_PRYPA
MHFELSPSQPATLLSAVLSLDEDCWPRVLRYCASHLSAVPGLAIHPCRAHAAAVDCDARLAALLAAHPAAIVGEAGLCHAARNLREPAGRAPARVAQLDEIARQLALGGALRRAAWLHYVRAHSAMAECFHGARAELPPAVALHSFSGGGASCSRSAECRGGCTSTSRTRWRWRWEEGKARGGTRRCSRQSVQRRCSSSRTWTTAAARRSPRRAQSSCWRVRARGRETGRRCADKGRRFLRGVGWGGGAAEGAREVDEKAAERAEMVQLQICIP